MSTPYGCALDLAYADWNFTQPNSNNKKMQNVQNNQNDQKMQNVQNNQKTQIMPRPQLHSVNTEYQNNTFDFYDSNETKKNIKSFCPNCQNCLKANDVLQQRILEQTIYPRPAWIPQYPQAFVPYDPYNRYWTNVQPNIGREDFGNFDPFGTEYFGKKSNIKTILQVILVILIALFIIQLVDSNGSSSKVGQPTSLANIT